MRLKSVNSQLRLMAFVCVFALTAGSLYTVAAQNHLNSHSARKPRAPQRIVPARSNLSGRLAGLKIVEVARKSLAAQAGLKFGDVLIAYNQRPITNEEEIDQALKFFQRQHDQTGEPATVELALYRDGDLNVTTIRVPIGLLGISTREWTLAGAFIEDAVVRHNDYESAEKTVDEAAASGNYTSDQLLHMRMLCVNNEVDGDKIRQSQVDELFRKYEPEKLRLFANYDLLYNKRYRAAVATLERYLKIQGVDVSTEISLASCYTELEKYNEADALLTKMLGRPKGDENTPTEYGLSVVSDLQAKIYMGRRQYDRAEKNFKAALERSPNDPYYTVAFLYCAAQRDITGEKKGEFDIAYSIVSARSPIAAEVMTYHIDALRAFVMVKRGRNSLARKIVDKWRESADARRYVPVFWSRFPDGGAIIDTWNLLMGDEAIALR